jgi:DNA-binding transcriptional MerR regulator
MEKSPDAFRTISEVSELLDTPPHVLRFWESRFPQVRPVKRAGGRRYYRPSDLALLAGIKLLLHDQGMTIRGVQKILREQGIRHVGAIGAGALAASGGVLIEAPDAAAAGGDADAFADADAAPVARLRPAPAQPAGQGPEDQGPGDQGPDDQGPDDEGPADEWAADDGAGVRVPDAAAIGRRATGDGSTAEDMADAGDGSTVEDMADAGAPDERARADRTPDQTVPDQTMPDDALPDDAAADHRAPKAGGADAAQTPGLAADRPAPPVLPDAAAAPPPAAPGASPAARGAAPAGQVPPPTGRTDEAGSEAGGADAPLPLAQRLRWLPPGALAPQRPALVALHARLGALHRRMADAARSRPGHRP